MLPKSRDTMKRKAKDVMKHICDTLIAQNNRGETPPSHKGEEL